MKHTSNKCKSYWTDRWGEDNQRTTEGQPIIYHTHTRRDLGLATYVVINYLSLHKHYLKVICDTQKVQTQDPSIFPIQNNSPSQQSIEYNVCNLSRKPQNITQ